MDDLNNNKMQDVRDDLNNRACQLATEGKYEESIKIFDELLAIDPRDQRALENKISVIGISGRYDEALDLYKKCVAEDRLSFIGRISYINLLTYFGKFEDALKSYRKIKLPGGVTNMLLGSLSEDFKQLKEFKSKTRKMEEAVRKMQKYRSEVKGGLPSDKSPRFMSLIWANFGQKFNLE
jgi:tetratricopeptide (TPR) repeat protein